MTRSKDPWSQSKVTRKIRGKKRTPPGRASMNHAKMVTNTLFLLDNIIQWTLWSMSITTIRFFHLPNIRYIQERHEANHSNHGAYRHATLRILTSWLRQAFQNDAQILKRHVTRQSDKRKEWLRLLTLMSVFQSLWALREKAVQGKQKMRTFLTPPRENHLYCHNGNGARFMCVLVRIKRWQT